MNACFDRPVRLPDLVAAMELALVKKALATHVDRGACYAVDHAAFHYHWLAALSEPWPDADHWRQVIHKYYGQAPAQGA